MARPYLCLVEDKRTAAGNNIYRYFAGRVKLQPRDGSASR
jgi:hypothetical protein